MEIGVARIRVSLDVRLLLVLINTGLLRNLNLIAVWVLLANLLGKLSISLTHSHDILLLLNQEVIQILLHSLVKLSLLRL